MKTRKKTRARAQREAPVRERKAQAGGRAEDRRPRQRPRVPPPESDIWPEEYRGANWKPVYAWLYAGKCQLCAHSCPLPKSRQLRDKYLGVNRLLHCTNHPANPGGIEEVLPTGTCRNFKEKAWHWQEKRRVQAPVRLPRSTPAHRVERIRLGHGLCATVDAVDYPEISRHKWYAVRYGRKVYALCKRNGRTVDMHRMLMKPRKGHIVDHKDGIRDWRPVPAGGYHGTPGRIRNEPHSPNRSDLLRPQISRISQMRTS